MQMIYGDLYVHVSVFGSQQGKSFIHTQHNKQYNSRPRRRLVLENKRKKILADNGSILYKYVIDDEEQRWPSG